MLETIIIGAACAVSLPIILALVWWHDRHASKRPSFLRPQDRTAGHVAGAVITGVVVAGLAHPHHRKGVTQ